MKKIFLVYSILLLTFFFQQLNSQVPDDTNGRLFYLCKTWGYLKYFNVNKCKIQWDTLLNSSVSEVLMSKSNTDFNLSLKKMLNKAGNNVFLSSYGSLPDTNINFDASWRNDNIFDKEIKSFLDTFSMYNYPNSWNCLVALSDYQYRVSGPSYIDFRKDSISMPIDYSDEANRLTTMFYYWNIINYFFPYKDLMDKSWDSTLLEFIPLIRNSKTEIDFHKTFLKLATNINDTHSGYTISPVIANKFWGGVYVPKIYFTRIDGQCVVTKVEDITEITAGDILTHINGKDIKEIEDSLSQFIPASTPAALYRDIYFNMRRGDSNSVMLLTLKNSNNSSYDCYVTRKIKGTDWFYRKGNKDTNSAYSITKCGYGYVNMKYLQNEDLPLMFESLKNTPAIIIDIRNYPKISTRNIAWFFFQNPVISAKGFSPALTSNSGSGNYFPGWYNKISDDYYWSNPDAYTGKVYILVNQETQSAAEYLCQYLSNNPNSKVIGTQTSGADGDVSLINLPGEIKTYFTSIGWYYADGYQQQRKGVRIDTIVSPTIKGITQGEDEILEAALDCLNEIRDDRNANKDINIIPNPAEDFIQIFGFSDKVGIYNFLGEKIWEGIVRESQIIDISNFAPGVYYIKNNNKSMKFIKLL